MMRIIICVAAMTWAKLAPAALWEPFPQAVTIATAADLRNYGSPTLISRLPRITTPIYGMPFSARWRYEYHSTLSRVPPHRSELIRGQGMDALTWLYGTALSTLNVNFTSTEPENAPRRPAMPSYSVSMSDGVTRAGARLHSSTGRNNPGDKNEGWSADSDLTLISHRLAKGLEFSASIYNLFDRRLADPAKEHMQNVFQQDGRTFRLKLNYRL